MVGGTVWFSIANILAIDSTAPAAPTKRVPGSAPVVVNTPPVASPLPV